MSTTTGYGTPENDIKQKVINNFSQNAHQVKQTIENASNDIYRLSDGNINLATRSLSTPGTAIAEQAGRYMSQGSTSEENYFYEQSKRMDKIIAVTSLIVGDYDQNKTAKHYEHINFNNQDVQALTSYAGYGTKAQDYVNNMLSSSSTIYNVSDSSNTSGSSSFNVSGQGMKVTTAEREEIKRTGQFTRTIDGHTYTYSVASYQGQSMTNAQVQSAVLNAEIEKTHRNSIIDKQGQRNQIAAYNKIKDDVLTNFNHNLKSEGINFNTGSHRECNHILRDINQKRQAILQEAMGNPAFASLHKDISKLTTQLKDPSIDVETKKNLKEILNKKNSQIREIGDFQKRIDNLNEHQKLISTYRDKFSQGTDRKGQKVSHRGSNSTLMGARIISKGLMGNDMQQGIDFYKKGYTVAKTSAKIVAKSSALGLTALEHAGHAGANFGLKLLDKHTTGRVNETVNSLINVNDNAHSGVKNIKAERKAEKEARRSGQGKDYRKQRQETHRKDRLEKRSTKTSKLQNEVADLKNKGNLSSSDSRKLRKNERKLRRIDRTNNFAKKFDWTKKVRERFERIGKRIGKVFGAIATPFKLLAAPFQWLNKLKATIIKYLMMGLGGFLAFYLGIIFIAILASILVRFVSSVLETDLTGIFDNRNYCQIIVDDICENLSPQMEKVCQTDAEIFYLNDNGKVESENYEWYKGVNEGEIRNIVDENGENVPSVTSNLLPIVSMMHYRYEDEINFDNWLTARAYVYYMYVTSHNIEGYHYDNENDCDDASLYTNGNAVQYDMNNHVLTRPNINTELCSNIYIHGYSKEYSVELNKLRAEADEFLSKAIAVLNTQLKTPIERNALSPTSGAWVQEKPHDSKGECSCYKAFQLGTTDADLNLNVCPGYTHNHTEEAGCYGNTCGKEEHDESCYDAAGNNICTDDNHHSHSDDCRGITCPLQVHSHNAWVDENNPGCYQTLYVCLGHCGGHITPQIDIIQEMTFESLAKLDTFKTTFFLTEVDFATANITGNHLLYRDLASWREHWFTAFKKWFVPFPKSPQSAILYAYGKIAYDGAKGIDSIMAFLSGSSEETYVEDPETSEDEFDFKGWFTESEELDMSLMGDLHDLYGVYEDNYEEGYQNWEDMGEVVFPVGNIRPLTSSQIADIMSQIKTKYPTLSESRLKVLEEALSKVGKYSYDLSAEGHNNGIYGESGRSECSGFVSGVLYRALGATQYTSGWSASTYANNGHSFSGYPTPGDILAHANGGMGQNGTSYTGHVVIYLGYLNEGIDGYESEACPAPFGAPEGHYIIECTNGYGINGSCIKKIEVPKYFDTYGKAYTGCY